MDKRKFLAPLAASVAVLLGTTATPVQALSVPVTASIEVSLPTTVADDLVLTRSSGSQLQLADHESHSSHSSHASHASHSSHVSGS